MLFNQSEESMSKVKGKHSQNALLQEYADTYLRQEKDFPQLAKQTAKEAVKVCGVSSSCFYRQVNGNRGL